MTVKLILTTIIIISLTSIAQLNALTPTMPNTTIITNLAPKETPKEECNLSIEPMWKELKGNATHSMLADEKWVIIGKVTFKNKVKETVKLEKLHLFWHGVPINYILGSLYKADMNNDFLPIESYLICDSTWNKTSQTLMLTFDKPESLGSLATFYVVLTVPHILEPALKQGYFQITSASLPSQFHSCALTNTLRFTMG